MPRGQQTTGKVQGRRENLTNAGKGRVKGVPNKFTGQLKEMILQALDEADPKGGVAYLTKQATENPGPFLSLVGKVLPMTIAGTGEGGEIVTRIILEGVRSE